MIKMKIKTGMASLIFYIRDLVINIQDAAHLSTIGISGANSSPQYERGRQSGGTSHTERRFNYMQGMSITLVIM